MLNCDVKIISDSLRDCQVVENAGELIVNVAITFTRGRRCEISLNTHLSFLNAVIRDWLDFSEVKPGERTDQFADFWFRA